MGSHAGDHDVKTEDVVFVLPHDDCRLGSGHLPVGDAPTQKWNQYYWHYFERDGGGYGFNRKGEEHGAGWPCFYEFEVFGWEWWW